MVTEDMSDMLIGETKKAAFFVNRYRRSKVLMPVGTFVRVREDDLHLGFLIHAYLDADTSYVAIVSVLDLQPAT